MGKPGDSVIYLKSVQDPAFSHRAALHLGRIYLDQGKLDEAVASLTAAEKSPDRQVVNEALLLRAEALQRQGKTAEMRAALTLIRTKFPYGKNYDAALLKLAQLDMKEGKAEQAASYLKELLYRRTPSREAVDGLETLLLETMQKNREEFEKLWISTGRWLMDPSRSASLLRFAQGLRTSGKPFLELCTWLVKYGSEEAKGQGRLLLADFYTGIGDAAHARGFLQQIKGVQTDDVIRISARISLLNRDAAQSSKLIMSVKEPREEDALFLIGLTKSHMADVHAVLAFCRKIAERDSTSPAALVRFADMVFDAGKGSESLALYRRAVAKRKVPAVALQESDREWAFYRIAALTAGEERRAALASIEKDNGTTARYAAADLRGRALQEKVK